MQYLLLFFNIHALTADWSGGLSIEEYLVKGYPSTNTDLKEYQMYLFELTPTITVNDALSLYFSVGFDSDYPGLTAGEYTSQNLLFADPPAGPFALSQFYFELYTKAGILTAGRKDPHWGLGAFYNADGLQTRDGLSLDMKLKSFSMVPFVYRLSQGSNLSRKASSVEYGLSFIYKNEPSNIQLGITYARTVTGNKFDVYDYDPTPPNTYYVTPNYNVIDLYLEKTMGDFSFKIEAPMIDGEVGDIYGTGNTKISATAAVANSTYSVNDKLSISADAGYVSGDDGSSEFKAMLLNPGYKVANVLFNYNSAGFDADEGYPGDPTFTSMTNTAFLKVALDYTYKNLNLNPAVLYAVPVSKKSTYNPLTNEKGTSPVSSGSSYGFEVDLNTSYAFGENTSVYSNIGVLLGSSYFKEMTGLLSESVPWSVVLGLDFSF